MKYIIMSVLICSALAAVLALSPVSATTYGSHYGVVDHWSGDGSGTGPLDVILSNLGAKWIRCAFDWDQIETPSKGVYNWTLQDNMINGMTAIGVNPYINIGYTPAWARPGGTQNNTPPTRSADYTDFITTEVNRYKDRVHYWGLWNEPNLSQFYNGTLTSYINNLLIPGISAIKAADANAHVCVADLSTSGDDVTALKTILQAIDSAGKHGQVDVICHHSYDGGDTAAGRIADIDTLHNMITSIGWGDKEFWISESGWVSSGTNGEANQANQLMGMVQGMDARPWWNKFFWFTMTEGSAGSYGLIRPDQSLKPSYTQYQTYISQHADDAQYVSDTIPTTMTTGQQYPVIVTMKNTGTTTWNDPSVWKLGAVGDSDPFAATRQYLNVGDSIAPDTTKSFAFTMTAPSTAGTYTTDWQMVHEGVRWFGHPLTKTVTVSGSTQTPYAGVIALPGTIQAENYDNGGQNIAYYDDSAGNAGGQYRSNDVDIATCSDTGGGYCVGWIDTGEWLEYTVSNATAGDYDFYVRVSSPNAGSSFKILIDGTDVSGARSFASTGSWDTWTTIIVPSRYLAAGQHILQFNVVSGGFNLNKIDVYNRNADAISVDLGNPDYVDGLSLVTGISDGDTVPWTVASHNCRENINTGDLYMYFAVNDAWALNGNKQNVYITFDYYDLGTGTLGLNYDAVGNQWAYVAGPALTNTGGWKQYTFHVTNAYFGNRENGGADFRICGVAAEWGLDTVCVYQ